MFIELMEVKHLEERLAHRRWHVCIYCLQNLVHFNWSCPCQTEKDSQSKWILEEDFFLIKADL